MGSVNKSIILWYGTLALFVFIFPWTAFAQQLPGTAKISGKLADEHGSPVSYATVVLLNAADSGIVRSVPASATGGYLFDLVHPGNYLIKVTAIGFTTSISKVISMIPGKEISIPLWQLASSESSLAMVKITAAKPLVEQRSDRLVVNVENSILSAGSSAMDILARSPGVTVDKDDNISLNGKEGVTVMINDKMTYLTATQLGALLRSTDGSAIKSLELITNPSSKFDAAGSSGIINIKLKKPTEKGTNGSLTAGLGYGKSGKDRTSLSLNHQAGGLNVFGSFSRDDNKSSGSIDTKSIVTGPAGNETYLNQETTDHTYTHNNSYRAGAEYVLSNRNTAGVALSGYFNTVPNPGQIHTDVGTLPGAIDTYQNTLYLNDQRYRNFTINIHDKLKIDTTGQELSIDLDRANFRNTTNSDNHTLSFLSDGTADGEPVSLNYQIPSSINVYSANADYTLPLSKTLKLESGLKYTSVKNNDDSHAEQLDGGTYLNDPALTNNFLYQEEIGAAYVSVNGNLKNLTFTAGLRAEHTGTTSDLVTTGESYAHKYLDLFPSLLVRRTLNDKNDIGFSFSRRIDRPEYDNFNPFLVYSDQYTYYVGNPLLKPQYANKAEISYTYNRQIHISLSYSHTYDAITHVAETDIKTNITTETVVNLQKQDNYSLNFYSPYKVFEWWEGYANLNGVYRMVRADSLLGGTLDRNKLAYTIKTTQNFQIAPGYKAELMSTYQSSRIYGIYTIRSRYTTDVGISHSFDQKRASIKVSVSDVFNTGTFRLYTNYQADNLATIQRPESRIGRITLNFNFGSTKHNVSEHEGSAADVKDRVKGA